MCFLVGKAVADLDVVAMLQMLASRRSVSIGVDFSFPVTNCLALWLGSLEDAADGLRDSENLILAGA